MLSLVKDIIRALVEAKKMCGESVEDFLFRGFIDLSRRRPTVLKERLGCEQSFLFY